MEEKTEMDDENCRVLLEVERIPRKSIKSKNKFTKNEMMEGILFKID